MIIYVLVNISILLLAIIYVPKKSNEITHRKLFNSPSDLLFLSSSFVLLFIISAFRGDFTSDYNGYLGLFKHYNLFSFREIFQYKFGQEIGYVILNRIIGLFTNDGIYIFIATSLIILFLFFREFRKESAIIWLSVLIFTTIGPFYTSFNIARQILSVAIIFAASRYLYKRNLIKYMIFVFLATLFHKTAIIMGLFYFVLNLRLSIKRVVFIAIGFMLSTFFIENMVTLGRKYFYTYYTATSYGMTGYNYKNVIAPILFLIFTLLHFKRLDLNDIKTKIWANAVIYYSIFSLFGLNVHILQRFSVFFMPYLCLMIPKIVVSVRNKNLKAIYILTAIFLLILYNYFALEGTGYDPYYFIWQSK